jgi:hypothetical protein
MAKTMQVPEAKAKKLFTELGNTKAKSMSGSKLTALLNGLEEAIEEMDESLLGALSKQSQNLLQKIIDTLGAKGGGKIVLEAAEEEEDDDEEKPTKKKAAKRAASNGEVSLRTQQSRAITSTVQNAKGPLTIEEIVAKTSRKIEVSEARVTGHMEYMEKLDKVKKLKGGKFALNA